MPGNAVSDCAKAREMDEKSLLKNGGQRIVEIGSLCESPQLLNDLGSFRCKTEEIGKNPESLLYSLLQFRPGPVHGPIICPFWLNNGIRDLCKSLRSSANESKVRSRKHGLELLGPAGCPQFLSQMVETSPCLSGLKSRSTSGTKLRRLFSAPPPMPRRSLLIRVRHTQHQILPPMRPRNL